MQHERHDKRASTMKDILINAIDSGMIFKSNRNGDFEVLEYITSKKVKVKFVDTGFIVVVGSIHIKSGKIKDKLKPIIHGIGFVGDGNHKPTLKGKNTKPYSVWRSMFTRCYCPKYQESQPTYKGCSVDPIWHNFQNFANWFDDNYKDGLHLDKDIKNKEEKVYSPESCSFVTCKENEIDAHAKHYRLTNPKGEVVNIYNMSEFAKENNLHASCMVAVTKGKRNHHKQWRKA